MKPFRPWNLTLLVLLLGASVSFATWKALHDREVSLDRDRFHRRAQRHIEEVSRRVERAADGLDNLAHLVVLRPPESDGAFHRLAALALPEPRRTGLLQVLLTEEVAPEGVDAWVARRRDEGHPDATIHDALGDAAPRGSETRHVLTRIHPESGYSALRGLDLFDPPQWRDLLARAVREGRAVCLEGGSVLATMGGPPDGGLLMVQPMYDDLAVPSLASREARLQGYVVGVIDPSALLRESLAEMGRIEPVADIQLTYTRDPTGVVTRPSRTRYSGQVRVLDEVLHVTVHRDPALSARLETMPLPASAVLPPGLLLAFALCAGLIHVVRRESAVVSEEVERRTAELRTKTLVLEGKERQLEDANRRLFEMSHTDPLTGVLNRRGYEGQLDKERDRASRTGRPYGLLIFDIDQFKEYNDIYGHVAGDEVLKRVASIIQGEARRIDCVARYGGEEFVVVASRTDPVGLMALGDRIRARVQEAAIRHEGSPYGIVTVSGGGSLSKPEDGNDPEPVITMADECLYKAKAEGRNRVTLVM